jgi:TolB protein
MKRIRLVGVCLATAVATVVFTLSPSAGATSPGRDGLIAFAIQDSTGIQIATVHADGSHFQKITSGDMISLDPAWSPDGKHLVFTHDTSNGTRLFRTDAQGRNPTLLFKDAAGWRDRTASYSPDGRRIVFARCGPGDGSCGISVMNADGSRPRVLVPADTGLEFGSFDPTFTPDGESVVFQGARRNTQSALFQIPVAGGAERQLTPTGLEASEANFSPDGRTMLFSSYCCTVHAQIYAMAAGGGHVRRLTNAAFRFDDFGPAWAPDGRSVIFASTRGHRDLCCGQIYTMHPDGSGIRVLVPENAGFLFGPAWQPLSATNGP